MPFGLTSICREDAVDDYDLYESEIEELYQKPEEPKVELTVEEAKTLHDLVYLLHESHNDEYTKGFSLWVANDLKERIEKAEGE